MLAILAMADGPDLDPVGRMIERFVVRAHEELEGSPRAMANRPCATRSPRSSGRSAGTASDARSGARELSWDLE